MCVPMGLRSSRSLLTILHGTRNATPQVALLHSRAPKSSRSTLLLMPLEQRRHASRSPAAQKNPSAQSARAKAAVLVKAATIPLDATTPEPKVLSPSVTLAETLNPPASTRPPPLDVPVRDPNTSLLSYLFKTGKAYVGFYKNGLKAILTNRRLVRELSETFKAPPGLKNIADTGVTPTRAAILLRERTRHDIGRLPIFGLVLLVCGEFTPLVVIAFPQLSPFTCRIPRQVDKLRQQAQDRRAASYRSLQHVHDEDALARVANGHIARVLDLGSRLWDRAGVDMPFADARVQKALERITRDDFMIKQGGGVSELVDEEVVLAAETRGADVTGRSVRELSLWLGKWIDKTTTRSEKEGQEVARRLLLRPEELQAQAKR